MCPPLKVTGAVAPGPASAPLGCTVIDVGVKLLRIASVPDCTVIGPGKLFETAGGFRITSPPPRIVMLGAVGPTAVILLSMRITPRSDSISALPAICTSPCPPSPNENKPRGPPNPRQGEFESVPTAITLLPKKFETPKTYCGVTGSIP